MGWRDGSDGGGGGNAHAATATAMVMAVAWRRRRDAAASELACVAYLPIALRLGLRSCERIDGNAHNACEQGFKTCGIWLHRASADVLFYTLDRRRTYRSV